MYVTLVLQNTERNYHETNLNGYTMHRKEQVKGDAELKNSLDDALIFSTLDTNLYH